MTIEEFGRTIKQKYPQYASFSDAEIGQKMIKKYPQYQGRITDNRQKLKGLAASASGQKDTSLLGKASNFLFGSTAKTVGSLIGSGYGSAKTLLGKATGNQEMIKSGETIENQFGGLGAVARGTTQTKPMTVGNIAFTALELYPGGSLITKALKKIPGSTKLAEGLAKVIQNVPEGLREQAIKQYSEALGATTNVNKKLTARVVPELLNRKVIATSLPKLEIKATEALNIAKQGVKTAEEAIPQTAITRTKSFVDELAKMKSDYIVDGKIIDRTAVKAIEDTAKTISQFGDEISTRSLIKVKRILDKSVSKANKNFTKDEGLTLLTEAREGMANAMRNVLNKDNPLLAQANKEYNLWSNVGKIVGDTIKRKSTQGKGLGQIIMRSGGGIAGFSSGDTLEQRVGRGILGLYLGGKAIEVFKSPAYKTTSAVLKNNLADAIAKGDIKKTTLIVNKIWAYINNLSE